MRTETEAIIQVHECESGCTINILAQDIYVLNRLVAVLKQGATTTGPKDIMGTSAVTFCLSDEQPSEVKLLSEEVELTG